MTAGLDIRFGHCVNSIAWGESGVHVSCTNGASFQADAVIVTVSLGVLKVLPVSAVRMPHGMSCMCQACKQSKLRLCMHARSGKTGCLTLIRHQLMSAIASFCSISEYRIHVHSKLFCRHNTLRCSGLRCQLPRWLPSMLWASACAKRYLRDGSPHIQTLMLAQQRTNSLAWPTSCCGTFPFQMLLQSSRHMPRLSQAVTHPSQLRTDMSLCHGGLLVSSLSASADRSSSPRGCSPPTAVQLSVQHSHFQSKRHPQDRFHGRSTQGRTGASSATAAAKLRMRLPRTRPPACPRLRRCIGAPACGLQVRPVALPCSGFTLFCMSMRQLCLFCTLKTCMCSPRAPRWIDAQSRHNHSLRLSIWHAIFQPFLHS